MSNTTPIPHDKNDVAICTAMAGEMLGFKLILWTVEVVQPIQFQNL